MKPRYDMTLVNSIPRCVSVINRAAHIDGVLEKLQFVTGRGRPSEPKWVELRSCRADPAPLASTQKEGVMRVVGF